MNAITIKKEEAKKSAIAAMENCMAYITTGDTKRALMAYGETTVWNELLMDFECDLCEENEHYKEMTDIVEATFAKAEVRPVVRAHWEENPGEIPHCSNCGEHSDDAYSRDGNFCQSCGAVMDEKGGM
jgi:hypothetical protein